MFWLRGTPGSRSTKNSALYSLWYKWPKIMLYPGWSNKRWCSNWTLKEQKILWRKLLIWGTAWAVSPSYALRFVLLWAINSVSRRAQGFLWLSEEPKEAFLLPSSGYRCPVPPGSFPAIPQALLRSEHLPMGLLTFLIAHNKNVGILFVVSSFIF